MAILEPLMIPELREYLAAERDYMTARLALIEAFAAAVHTQSGEGLTERQIVDKLRLQQVPEDLISSIEDKARHPELPTRP